MMSSYGLPIHSLRVTSNSSRNSRADFHAILAIHEGKFGGARR
jgi:hypothetical protein